MRHHRKGPTKKLAPAVKPEADCPHVFREDEGVQLEVDCGECPGAHDLGNARCLSGVLAILSEGAQPDAIVLKRYIHKRYRGEPVRRVRATASMLSSINRRLGASKNPSDRRCRTCPASADSIMLRVRRRLLSDPEDFAHGLESLSAEITRTSARIQCHGARECISNALAIVCPASGGG